MLLDLIREKKAKSVSVVGMVKNAGKTVVLNYLIKECAQKDFSLGLTSIGRDGEKTDAVFRIPKPGINVSVGTLIATAQNSLNNCTAQVEILENTGFSSAMGDIFIGRITKPGLVELAGPTLICQLDAVISQIKQFGAELVLVDGAFDRISSADPFHTESTILATGAALGGSMADVLSKTKDRIDRFSLSAVQEEKLPLYSEMIEQKVIAVIDKNKKIKKIECESSLTAGESLTATADSMTRTVVLPGAVGNKAMEYLTKIVMKTGVLEVIIRNGTCLFSDRSLLQKFSGSGGKIYVIEPIQLLAVTINPFFPVGPCFIPADFLKIAQEKLTPYPVIDVVYGKNQAVDR